jgi:hypothetical protein
LPSHWTPPARWPQKRLRRSGHDVPLARLIDATNVEPTSLHPDLVLEQFRVEEVNGGPTAM